MMSLQNDTDKNINRALKLLALVLLSIALAGIVFWFLGKIRAVVIILVGAIFFAYLIYPAVRLLQRRVPRWLAIVTVYTILLLALGTLWAFIGPKISLEAQMLVRDFPNFVSRANQTILHANSNIVAAVPIEARETAAKTLDQIAGTLQRETEVVAGQVLAIVLSVASVATALVIVPILTFYILFDLDRIGAGLLGLFPSGGRAIIAAAARDVDAVLAGFVRGQVLVGAIVAVLITAMLLLLHIKYAFLIGMFAGVMDIIPYVGAIAGAVPAVIIAAFSHSITWALVVAASFVVVYQLEGHIIAPNVVGQRVGLSPLMVIVSILVGAELGGIGGMFVAVPIAAVVRVLWQRFMWPSISIEPLPAPPPPRAEQSLAKVPVETSPS